MIEKGKVQNEIVSKVVEPKSSWMIKATPFIACNISLERFCTAGILAILPLFLHKKLGLSSDASTSIFHIFECLMLIFTVFGAIIADTWLGLYQSVVSMSCIYILGLGIITMAMIESLNLPTEILVALGLVVMLVGSGCLKNNLNAFGGGQHKLPEQKKQLEFYFSIQYFGVKFGSFIARIIFPILREDVKCFNSNDCYSLTFGIPTVIMLFGLLLFLSGSFYYIRPKCNGNMLVRVIQCAKHALQTKSSEKKEHWLEYSEERYGKKLVMETKIALKIILISVPIPMFWACLMLQRSRWIFQAVQMNGDLGFYVVKPDQMIVFNSVIAVLLIPVIDKFIYPLLEKIGIKTMLQRLIFGGVLIIIALINAIVLQTEIEKNHISILWQLPQYMIIGTAEILTYLSHLNFAYKEAPASMKPVMMSLLYVSMAGGDMIVAIISGLSAFQSQVYEFSFFACLVLVDVIVLAFLASNYKPTDHETLNALDEAPSDEKIEEITKC